MCGIAGQVALEPGAKADGEQVARLLGAIGHRGPDGEGLFTDPRGRAALGMRRLAVIDLVSGQQPVFNEDGSIACVFNGEIYNFEALRADLARRGHVFRTASDTEVIVHAYEEQGLACMTRLRGMFAFAIWDQRDQSFLLARDRMGKKPVYYTEAGGCLSFASEIHALYELPSVSKEIDPVALELYLDHGYIPAPRSIFRSIRKLPPAHFISIRQGRLASAPYWRLAAPPAAASMSREDLVRALTAKVDEAVRLRMVSDVPIGCFLSGGVDSSAVAALMSRASPRPIRTFSIGFPSARFDELPYARAVAEHIGAEHHEFVVEPDAAAALPAIARHFGEPFGDASALPTWYLSQLARRHVTVALNGDGGDELFGGYTWYRTALALDRAGRLLPGWAPPAIEGMGRWLGPRVSRLGRRLGLSPARQFDSLRRGADEALRQSLYSSEHAAAARRAADEYLVGHYAASHGDHLARMQYTDMMTYLPDDLLVKVDRMTMAHSLEARSPLLDQELIELCAGIPRALKIDRRGGKAIFREVVGAFLPPRFFDRPKMGFTVPLAEWLRGPLRAKCEALTRSDALGACGLNPEAVRRVVDEHAQGKADRGEILWRLLALGAWSEVYLAP